VLPELGDLTQVAANVTSRKGAISVDIKRGPPFAMQVVVPAATRATVGVPIDAVTTQGSAYLEVTTDITVVFSAGTSKPSASVTFAGEAPGYVKFVLGPGTHTLRRENYEGTAGTCSVHVANGNCLAYTPRG
jgi:hypothetical protein